MRRIAAAFALALFLFGGGVRHAPAEPLTKADVRAVIGALAEAGRTRAEARWRGVLAPHGGRQIFLGASSRQDGMNDSDRATCSGNAVGLPFLHDSGGAWPAATSWRV